ncbi:MAG: DUF983 domain-containing protein [Candidatus Poribacteria bacterium]|nr:DUF983 domain-containing protein [Candidatus Poribacteria bacterium]MYK20195.1 DUF983 domain-containing protein [Candidatus Poribacteria bacterium]
MKFTFKNLTRTLRCSFRLKCPRCGKGALFQTFFKMFTHCTQCNLKFERESGYFIGAMYLNYGATVLIAFASYFLAERFTSIPFFLNLSIWGLFSAIFPIIFYRYSKSLWLNFDYTFSS